jgi:hypothetical protein
MKAAAGTGACIKCGAGDSCTTTAYTDCDAGKFSGGIKSSCDTSPAGYVASNSETAVSCNDGFYSTAGLATCLECPAGNYCDSKGKTACPTGTYALKGSKMCAPCPYGYGCSATEVTQCKAIEYLLIKDGYGTCTECPANTICDGSDVIVCQPG